MAVRIRFFWLVFTILWLTEIMVGVCLLVEHQQKEARKMSKTPGHLAIDLDTFSALQLMSDITNKMNGDSDHKITPCSIVEDLVAREYERCKMDIATFLDKRRFGRRIKE